MHCPPWTEEDIIWAVRLSGVTDGHDVGAGNQTATFNHEASPQSLFLKYL